MATKTKGTKGKKAKRLSTAEVILLANAYEEAKSKEAEAQKVKSESSDAIIAELDARDLTALDSNVSGTFTRVSKVQAERTEYNGDALFRDLTPAQRRDAFDFSIDLSVLPADDRKAINKALLDLLTPAQRKVARVHRLNVERLSLAVQDGKIPVDVVAKHSEIVKNKPYISISHGTGS